MIRSFGMFYVNHVCAYVKHEMLSGQEATMSVLLLQKQKFGDPLSRSQQH